MKGRPKNGSNPGKPTGRPAKYNHSKIKEMTLLGKSAQEIADEIGCKIEYVYELRYKKRFGVVR